MRVTHELRIAEGGLVRIWKESDRVRTHQYSLSGDHRGSDMPE
jgi:hypothetical protein